MRSIKNWARPFALVAALGLLGLSQVGCVEEICEDVCRTGCGSAGEACTPEDLQECIDACDIGIF
jgi:hypothetical protein